MARAYGKWKITNPITVERFTQDLSSGAIGIQSVLIDVGVYVQKEMMDITSKSDASGRLTDSITWQMGAGSLGTTKTGRPKKTGSNKRSAAKDTDIIDKPSTPDTVIIGSQAPHAKYRETFSGTHKTVEGHELFVEEMKNWCREKLGIDPERSPEDKEAFYLILKSVRESVTQGDHFVSMVIPKVIPFAMKRFKMAITKYLKAQGAKK